MYPEAKSVGLWLRHGWHVAIAYVIGFFVMLAVLGWHADPAAQEGAGPACRRYDRCGLLLFEATPAGEAGSRLG